MQKKNIIFYTTKINNLKVINKKLNNKSGINYLPNKKLKDDIY